jgi:hypothetical protein
MTTYRTVRRFARTRYYSRRCGHLIARAVVVWGAGIAYTNGWLTIDEYRRVRHAR